MTKLVDVQGLKPCPKWGSGSSPDTGIIINLLNILILKSLIFSFYSLHLVFEIASASPILLEHLAFNS